jgi:O-methyltransferase
MAKNQIQRLGHADYHGVKYPIQLSFLNPDTFLYNSDELDELGWSANDNSWHRTDLYNRERYLFLELAFDYLLSYGFFGGTADYFEFGCHGANTFRMALSLGRRFCGGLEFHAFDSFQGLPPRESDEESGIAGWGAGEMAFELSSFTDAISKYKSQQEKIHIHKGFYSESLSKQLQCDILASGRIPRIINIDCDLVQSYVEVLNFISPLLRAGTILYFDEYFVSETGDLATGPRSVIHRFERTSEFQFVPFRPVGWWGMSFICASKL